MPKISKVVTDFDRVGRPVIVEFQNGKVQPGEEGKLESCIFRNESKETLVGVSSGNMLYTGLVDNENDLYNKFLVIHNKRKNKIRLVQVDQCMLAPFIEQRKENLNLSVVDGKSSVVELNKQFGSKRTKRQTEQQERLKMNIDAVKDDLEKTVSDIKISENDLVSSQMNENDSLYAPKINRDAASKEQVYKLDDLVPSQILQTLKNKASNILNAEDEDNDLLPFIAANVAKIKGSSIPDEAKLDKCTILLYLNFLVKYMATPMKSITKKFIICDCSTEVDNHIKNNFTVKTPAGWQRPLAMKDKSLCYILVMLVLAMDFEADIEGLSKDMKIGMKKLIEISRVLAFSSSSKGKNVITLKLPLPAPVITPNKRKRR